MITMKNISPYLIPIKFWLQMMIIWLAFCATIMRKLLISSKKRNHIVRISRRSNKILMKKQIYRMTIYLKLSIIARWMRNTITKLTRWNIGLLIWRTVWIRKIVLSSYKHLCHAQSKICQSLSLKQYKSSLNISGKLIRADTLEDNLFGFWYI